MSAVVASYGSPISQVTAIIFADGSSIDLTEPITFTGDGTAGNETLTGTGLGNNLFLAGTGDTLVGTGTDTYEIASGVGSLTIDLGTSDTIGFTDATTAANLVFGTDKAGDLRITNSATGTVITVAGDLSSSGSSAVSTLLFADGTSLDLTRGIPLTWDSTAGHESLTGPSYGNNLFLAGTGDTLIGGGTDTYEIGDGVGSLTIEPGSHDAIRFTDATTAANLVFATDDAGDLLITNGSTGAVITVAGGVSSGSSTLSTLLFANGTSLDLTRGIPFTWNGAAGKETLTGPSYGNNLFIAGTGDTLIGGATDTYEVGSGVGALTVEPGSSDLIRFTDATRAGDVRLSTDGAGDLIVTDTRSGAVITVSGGLSSDGQTTTSAISTIIFSDGTSIDLSQPVTAVTLDGTAGHESLTGNPLGATTFLAGTGDTLTGGGANTFVIGNGVGSLTIDPGVHDVIRFTDATAAANIAFTTDAAGDLLITNSATRAVITVADDFPAGFSALSTIVFGGGTSLDLNQGVAFTWDGTAGHETLTGPSYGNNLFIAGTGDTLIGGGTDTYDIGSGVGAVTIEPGSSDLIRFTDATRAGDLLLSTDGAGDLILSDTRSGAVITVGHDLSSDGQITTSTISTIRFSDGTSLDLSQPVAAVTLDGTAGHESLTGNPLGTTTFLAGTGDTLIGSGTNTFVIGSGVGSLTIDPGASNVIRFTDATSVGDLAFTTDAAGDLLISNSLTGAVITVAKDVSAAGAGALSTISLADGISLDLSEGIPVIWDGTAGNQTLTGNAAGTNLFLAGTGDTLIGGGIDTYVIGSGAGSLTIDPDANDAIAFTDATDASDLAFATDGAGDLLITNTRTGGAITVAGNFSSTQASVLSMITFADGISLDLSESVPFIANGVAGHETLTGNSADNNLFFGGTGDTLIGGGTDTYVIGQGAGSLTIDPGSNDVIAFTDATTADNLVFTTDSAGDLLIRDTATGGVITVVRDFSSTGSSVLSTISFANGTSLDLSQGVSFTWNGTAGHETLAGFADGTNLFLAGTGDTLIGAGTDTYEIGSGVAALTIDAGSTDGIVFTDAATADDLVFTTDSARDLLISDTATGGVVTVVRDFSSSHASVVATIRFANGTSLDLSQGVSFTWDGTVGHETLTGSADGTNLFRAGTGDTLIGTGTDTYAIGSDVGALTIDPGRRDTIRFTDATTVAGDLSSTGSSVLSTISFAGGTSLDLSDGVSLTWNGTAGHETVTGMSGDSNLFLAGTGDTLVGGGSDTYEIGSGVGALTIDPGVGDVLRFTDVTSASDLVFATDAAGNLMITDSLTGAVITVAGDLSFTSANALSTILFANGTSLDLTEGVPFTWDGTAGNETLAGQANADNLFLAGTGDTLIGGGSDTYEIGRGVGALTIDPNISDVIAFTDATTATDLVFTTDASGDLTITDTITGAVITVAADFAGTNTSVLSTIRFANGTSLDLSQGVPLTWNGALGNETLTGVSYGNNQFLAGTGDTLIGDGTDTYLIGSGVGAVTIDPGKQDSIVFTDATTASDVRLSTDGAGDLIVTDTLSGAVITVTGDLSSTGQVTASVLPVISFANGTRLDLTQPVAAETLDGTIGHETLTGSPLGATTFLAGTGDTLIGGGSNSFVLGSGVGSLTIDPGVYNAIAFTDATTASDLVFTTDKAGDLFITNSLTGAVTAIADDFSTAGSGALSKVLFADGTSVDLAGGIPVTWNGTAGHEIVRGHIYDNNLFLAGTGDTLIGSGTDTYAISAGVSALTINPGSHDSIRFTDATTAADLVFGTDYNRDLIITDTVTGTVVTAVADFSNAGSSSLSTILFANGTSLDLTHGLTFTWDGTAGNAYLFGVSYGSNLFLAGTDDTLIGSGTNTYEIASGVGALTIEPGKSDTIRFTDATTARDIQLATDAAGDLVLTDTLSGAMITVADDLSSNGQTFTSLIPSVDFADGTSLDLNQPVTTAFLDGTAGNTTVTGKLFDATTFLAGTGDTLTGGGINTFLVGSKVGNLTINPGGANKIRYMDATTAKDITFRTDSAGDLLITNAATGAVITVTKDFSSGNSSAVSTILFADGTSLDLTQGVAFSWDGAVGNETLTGSFYGNNLFLAGTGDTLIGGGSDTYVIGNGAGSLSIDPGESDTIQFTDATTASDIRFTTDSARDLLITNTATGAVITAAGDLSYTGNSLSTIAFADGSSLDLQQGLTFTWDGTAGHETLTGSSYGNASNLFLGGDGDTLIGGYENIFQFGTTAGTETISIKHDYSDRLAFTSGLTAADVTLILQGPNLLVQDAAIGLNLTVVNDFIPAWWTGSVSFSTGSLSFADGTSLDPVTAIDTLEGTGGNDYLAAWRSGQVLDGEGGDATLAGSSGTNVYVYGPGYGDTVIDDSANSVGSTIALKAGLTPQDLSFATSGDDQVITVAEAGTITVRGQTAGHKVTTVTFADDSSIELNPVPTFVWNGTAGHKTLTGSSNGNNLFLGGNGDILQGVGTDIFQFGTAAGTETVTLGSNDTLTFGAGITAASVTLTEVGGDLVITDAAIGLDVTVKNDLAVAGGNLTVATRAPVFADSTSLNPVTAIDTLEGTAGNDTLTAWRSGLVLDGEGGNDTLIGSAGTNSYVYGRGYGNTVIDDSANAAGSTIALKAGLTWKDLSYTVSGNDLVITVAGAGTITVRAQLTSEKVTILAFADGSSVDLTQPLPEIIDGRAGNLTLTAPSYIDATFLAGPGDTLIGGGTDTYDIGAAVGTLTIEPAAHDVIHFTDATTAANIRETTDASGDLILTDTASRAVATVVDDLVASGSTITSAIPTITFADGTSLSLTQGLTFTWDGTAGNETVTGSSRGNNLFLGGNGDILIGAGTDTFQFGSAAGTETVTLGSHDTLSFGAGITAAAVTLTAVGGDLVITDAAIGLDVTVKNDLGVTGGDLTVATGTLTFTDGIRLNPVIAIDTLEGTAGNDTLTAWRSGLVLDGEGGNDTLIGSAGTNSYVYGPGYGNTVIDDSANAAGSTIALKAGLTWRDLSYTVSGNDLVITVAGAGTITVQGHLTSDKVTILAFADGSSVDLTQVLPEIIDGRTGNLTLTAPSFIDATFLAGTGDTLIGGGTLTIEPAAHDVIHFTDATTATNIRETTDASGDLILTDTASRAVITVAGGTSTVLPIVTFADGTSLDLNRAQTFTWDGTAGDETLTGSSHSNNLFLGGNGDTLQGVGTDTFQFGSAAGTETVTLGSHDTLTFGAGITAAAVTLAAVGGDLLIADAAIGLDVTVKSDLTVAGGNLTVATGALVFADGTSLNPVTAIDTLEGTAGNDTLTAWRSGLVLDGEDGNDTLIGSAGSNTYVYGRGYGDDVINDGANSAGSMIALKAGLTRQDLSFAASGNDLVISVAGARTITIQGQITAQKVTTVSFSDGTSLDLLDPSLLSTGGPGHDPALTAWVASLSADAPTMSTAVAASTLRAEDVTVLALPTGINSGAVMLSTDAAGDLVVTATGTGSSVTITRDLNNDGGSRSSALQTIAFADGTAWNLANADNLIGFTYDGAAGHQTLTGTGWGANTFVLGADDTVTGGLFDNVWRTGGSGDNSYLFGRGDGGSVITPGTTDTLELAAGISENDILLSTDAVGDLILTLADTGDNLTVNGDFRNIYGSRYSTVQTIIFNDGTIWNLADANNAIGFTYDGRAGHETLAGTGWGANTFLLGTGDTVTGGLSSNAWSTGGSGVNSYDIGSTAGGSTITLGTSDTIAFGDGIDAKDLWFARNGNALQIDVLGTGEQITVANGAADPGRLSEITAADGLALGSQLNQLIDAMATFSAGHSDFNPLTSSMPMDSIVQATLASSWHKAA